MNRAYRLRTATSVSPVTGGSEAARTGSALLLAACRRILGPLARLAIERGVVYAEMDDLLRRAFVEAAREVHPGATAQRAASRISAATGLTRREVARLLLQSQPSAALVSEPRRRSPATEVFTRWLTDKQLRGTGNAGPQPLPRQGPAPSFESLAQSVTKDVHPRTLLEELLRLGLARLDDAGDTVWLVRETFVPADDETRLLGFLGANVGDHLSAAVANVLSPQARHLEQALFADELSSESIDQLRPLIAEQWQSLVRQLVPKVQQFIEDDRAAGRAIDQRLRVGVYTYTQAVTPPPAAAPDDGAAVRPDPSTRQGAQS